MNKILNPLLLIAAIFIVCSCTFESRISNAAYVDSWDSFAPHAQLELETSPMGATIEILNEENEWTTVGSTPNIRPIVLEATGKTYIFRVSKRGYYDEVVRVSLNQRNAHITVPLRKDVFVDPEDYMHTDFKKDTKR